MIDAIESASTSTPLMLTKEQLSKGAPLFQCCSDKMFLLSSYFDFPLREETLTFQTSRREALGQYFYIALDLTYQQRNALNDSVQQFSATAVAAERERLRLTGVAGSGAGDGATVGDESTKSVPLGPRVHA